MTRKEITNYLKLRPSLPPQKRAMLQLDLHQRVAEPWMCLVMVLLGVTVGTRAGRRGPMVSVASSLALFFAYWFVCQVSYRMGEAGYIETVLAAWAPNAVFGLIGLIGYGSTR